MPVNIKHSTNLATLIDGNVSFLHQEVGDLYIFQIFVYRFPSKIPVYSWESTKPPFAIIIDGILRFLPPKRVYLQHFYTNVGFQKDCEIKNMSLDYFALKEYLTQPGIDPLVFTNETRADSYLSYSISQKTYRMNYVTQNVSL